jgi:hypothetical protein
LREIRFAIGIGESDLSNFTRFLTEPLRNVVYSPWGPTSFSERLPLQQKARFSGNWQVETFNRYNDLASGKVPAPVARNQ